MSDRTPCLVDEDVLAKARAEGRILLRSDVVCVLIQPYFIFLMLIFIKLILHN